MHPCNLPAAALCPHGARYRCSCGREYVVWHGDGMMTPPRPYWHQRRRLHLRRYSSHKGYSEWKRLANRILKQQGRVRASARA